MQLQIVIFSLALMSLVGCASPSPVSHPSETKKETSLEQTPKGPGSDLDASMPLQELAVKSDNNQLICKASRRRFHYGWSAGALDRGREAIDQNNVRYEFRSAKRPAGGRGENLKVGECGWAKKTLAVANKKTTKSQVTFKSLTEEVTQTFYKIKTGKVFTVPVRQTKNGLVAAPGGVSLIH